MKCQICKENHLTLDCDYLPEAKCKTCQDPWHLTKHHKVKNVNNNACIFQYNNNKPQNPPCQDCKDNGGGIVPHCKENKRCLICLSEMQEHHPQAILVELAPNETSLNDWKQAKYNNFCSYWWKTKFGEGEDNFHNKKKVRNKENDTKPPSNTSISDRSN